MLAEAPPCLKCVNHPDCDSVCSTPDPALTRGQQLQQQHLLHEPVHEPEQYDNGFGWRPGSAREPVAEESDMGFGR